MKRVFFSAVLMLATSFTFAQVKSVKEAKSIANGSDPDFNKAEQLIQGALVNPETMNDPETWNVAGLIQKKRSDKETEKGWLHQPYDTLQVYNSILGMSKYFYKCDELAQVPDEKGKIKNKYRKTNAATLLAERGNLINGGIHFYNNDDNQKALEFFAAYVDMAAHPMFEKENLLQTDTLLPQIAYYASLAAMKIQNYPSVVKYAPYAQDDKEVGPYAMEFRSTALKALGDTVQFVASLKEGLNKYPNHTYFFGNLIDYYTNSNKMDEAMQFADDMLAKDPNSAFNLYVKAYLYNNLYNNLKSNEKEAEAKEALEKSVEFYKKTIEADATYAEAYSNLGMTYCLQAQDLGEDNEAGMKALYEKAKECYEKARELKPDNRDLWLQGLYRVYYILREGEKFEEIEQMMQ